MLWRREKSHAPYTDHTIPASTHVPEICHCKKWVHYLNNGSVGNIIYLHIFHCMSNKTEEVYLSLHKFSKPE
jgi:hypothetical protein